MFKSIFVLSTKFCGYCPRLLPRGYGPARKSMVIKEVNIFYVLRIWGRQCNCGQSLMVQCFGWLDTTNKKSLHHYLTCGQLRELRLRALWWGGKFEQCNCEYRSCVFHRKNKILYISDMTKVTKWRLEPSGITRRLSPIAVEEMTPVAHASGPYAKQSGMTTNSLWTRGSSWGGDIAFHWKVKPLVKNSLSLPWINRKNAEQGNFDRKI